MLQVYFYQNSNSNNNFYSVLFPNSNYKGSDANSQGFPVVIPNGKAYDRYQVQWCYANGGTKIYKSNSHTLYSDTVPSGYTQIPRIVTAYKVSTHTSENICVLNKFSNITIYFESNVSTFYNSTSNQKIYCFGGSGSWDWPGDQMQYVGKFYNDAYKRYSYSVDPNNYKKFIANCNDGGWQAPEASFTPADNGAIYQNYYDNNNMVTRKNGTYNPNNADLQEVIDSYATAAVDWAHYSAKQ
jgi:hypothetical protein